jgi:hypothetical protein
MRRWLSPCIFAALGVSGCGTSRLADGFEAGQSRIRVLPSVFIGDVPCSRAAGDALQSYAVKLSQTDQNGQLAVAADAGTATERTSPPAPCDQAIVFAVFPFAFYAAEILGFDRPAAEVQVASAVPRWTATCGRGNGEGEPGAFGPTRAEQGLTVPLRGCTSFSAGDLGTSVSRLVVDVDSARGELVCGSGPGRVGFFEAVLGGTSLRAACGEPLVFELTGPARHHTIEVTGYEIDPDAGIPPLLVDAGPPDAATPPAPDGGLLDASSDSGPPLDAGSSPAASDAGAAVDAGSLDGGNPAVGWVGVARWRTRCLGRSVPGVVSTAGCEPLQPLPR